MQETGEWMLIFDHTLEQQSDLFTSIDEAKNSNTKRKYSRLGFATKHLKNFCINGKYEFIMEYPNEKQINHWTQTIFPTLAKPSKENGYVKIRADNSDYAWHGLSVSNASQTYLDGSPYHPEWYYPIGQSKIYDAYYCIPKPVSGRYCISRVKLWVKVNLSSFDLSVWSLRVSSI